MILVGHRPARSGAPARRSAHTGSAHSAGFAPPRLMSFNARQQFLFQPSPTLTEPRNLHLEAMEEFHDLAVLVTERVEA